MTMILAVLLSFQAHAGWFGPSDDEVVVTPVLKCRAGEAGFRIENKSKSSVDKVSFYIYGKEDGHSTEYQMSLSPVEFDEILAPGKASEYCLDLRKVEWPDNKVLKFFAKNKTVEFQE